MSDLMKIGIEGLILKAPVGYYEWEREEGVTFRIDAELMVDCLLEVNSDFIGNTVDYELIISLIEEKMGKPCKLMETLLNEIQVEILKRFPKVLGLKLRISKLNPVKGKAIDTTFVEREFHR